MSMQVSNYIVGYFDLLGQSEKLSEYPLVPTQNTDEFKRWIKSTFGLVSLFKKAFSDFLKSTKQNRSSFYQQQNLSIDKISLKAFSDSIIVYSPILDDPKRIVQVDVYTIIQLAGLIYLLLLSQKIPIRGAIEIGVGMEMEEIGFYGSAISKAYCLESKYANFPRIVVGQDLISYLLFFYQL
jgi:hypothetical protein